MAVQNPVHFDIVGSFLRPERLKKAREAFRSGALGQAGLRRVEDEEIRKLISKEKALGLRTLTDGEFRREYWHLDFMWGLGGIKRETLSHWAARGGYLPIAPLLFAREKVHTLYLEFDDERSGGFAPLRYVSPDKTVVLGLVTTKRPDLEDPERIRERIKEAAQYVPLSRLSLSPQCGFASTEIGNKLTEEDQWKKIALVRDIAQTVWG